MLQSFIVTSVERWVSPGHVTKRFVSYFNAADTEGKCLQEFKHRSPRDLLCGHPAAVSAPLPLQTGEGETGQGW